MRLHVIRCTILTLLALVPKLPGHVPAVCAPLERTKELSADVRKLLSIVDSTNNFSPGSLGILADPPESVVAVSDSSLCARAGQAFRVAARGTMTEDPDSVLLVVRVARTPHYFFVDNAAFRREDGIWEVFIFRTDWSVVISYGGGA